MKKWILAGISALFILSIQSCTNEEETYSLNNIWVSMGIVETGNEFGYRYMIRCDNGDTLLPANTAVPGYQPIDSSRVVVNYTLLDDVEGTQQLYYASINNINSVLFKDIIEHTNENTDSLGNDPIMIEDIWRVDSMLNIDFKVWGSYKTHYINLAYDSLQSSDSKKTVNLKLLHNNNNDDESYLLNGLVTFKLNKLKTQESDSVYFTVESVDYADETHTYNGTFTY
ncbi:MAG TPA: NigD-like C-terminal domain-containing protein [Prolixibacteraceae bacterium]|nr:NigD-like C-terminal domain-containing protein [Prolixibacteraceae bacterium]